VLYSTSEGVIYDKAWAAMAVVALPSPFAALVLLCSLLYPIDPKPPVLYAYWLHESSTPFIEDSIFLSPSTQLSQSFYLVES
jgi:hypothetical protein